MARTFVVLAALVACLAVAAYADYCPQESEYNGCTITGCISVVSPGSERTTVVCNECGLGYVLVNQGTKNARCDCAPGYAGKGNNLICKACPTDTQIAPGGSKSSSACLNCPPGTTFLADIKDCVCPGGSYRAAASYADKSLKQVACKPCTAQNAFVALDNNRLTRCSTCRSGKVANNAHTTCVDPSDPDAAQTLIANATSALIQDAATAIQNMFSKVGDLVDVLNPAANKTTTTVGDINIVDWIKSYVSSIQAATAT